MSEKQTPAPRPSSERWEHVVAELCDHFAAGHIELDELERRLAVADGATSLEELDGLLGDLPELPQSSESLEPAPETVPASAVKSRGWALALMGGNRRKGVWTPPRVLHSAALMGGVELDFREARMAPGLTRVTAVAVMGGIDITVPPGLPVQVRGLGIMGAVDQTEWEPGFEEPGRPRLEVNAFALMGGVEVKIRPRAAEPGGRERGRRGRGS